MKNVSVLLAFDSGYYCTTHCMSRSQLRAAVPDTTKCPLQLCSGHSLAMCCAVWFAAPHSHDADGDGSGVLANVVLDYVLWICLMECG